MTQPLGPGQFQLGDPLTQLSEQELCPVTVRPVNSLHVEGPERVPIGWDSECANSNILLLTLDECTDQVIH